MSRCCARLIRYRRVDDSEPRTRSIVIDHTGFVWVFEEALLFGLILSSAHLALFPHFSSLVPLSFVIAIAHRLCGLGLSEEGVSSIVLTDLKPCPSLTHLLGLSFPPLPLLYVLVAAPVNKIGCKYSPIGAPVSACIRLITLERHKQNITHPTINIPTFSVLRPNTTFTSSLDRSRKKAVCPP